MSARRNSRRGKSGDSRPTLAQWPRILVPLVRLHLDTENPRHEPVISEDAAIAELYENEKVAALASDIVAQQAMSPLDAIGVIAMPGNSDHFVAVEGNRRLCALLLLNDPDRAPTAEARAHFRALSDQIEMPEAIEVVRFESRDDAKHWLRLRHLGPQDGLGLVSWTPTQKDRAAGGGQNALAVAVLDRANAGGWLGSNSPPAVTTLTRYLNSPIVREALGLGDSRRLVFTHEPGEVDTALQHFLFDAFPSKDGSAPKVHSRSNKTGREAYARELRSRNVSPRTVLDAPMIPPSAKAETGNKASRSKADPAKRKCIVPTDFKCKASDKNLRMLFAEMKRTDIEDHEFACAYLLRAFLERVMFLYMQKANPSYRHPKDDRKLVEDCSKRLDPTRKVPRFKNIRIAETNSDASHSLHTLGAAVHSNHLMNRKDLINAWGNWEVALKEMMSTLA